jgi:hypothetical protein
MKRLIATLVTFGFLGLAVPAVYAEEAPKDEKTDKKEDGKDKKAKKKDEKKKDSGW